jgi:hypothetical protein
VYFESIGAEWQTAVRTLDALVTAVKPDFEVQIAYGILIYSLPGAKRSQWVCAISTTTKAVQLRFLYGYILDDPSGVLRAGTGVLRTIDFASAEDIDEALVTDYVTRALEKWDEFVASADQG